MKLSLREALIRSHVAAIAIAVLMVCSFESFAFALWQPAYSVGSYLLTAVAIQDIPYFRFRYTEFSVVFLACFYLFYALVELAAASALSRLVYGMGPLDSLRKHCATLARKANVRSA